MARTLQAVEQPHTRPRGRPSTGGTGSSKTPRARFKEIAPKRITDAKNAMEFLKKLNNPAVYQYSRDEAEQMITLLKETLDGVAYSLRNPGKETPVLTFDDE